ncbi:MAG: alpha/beta fold hydrolase [Candidatus Angelobacter sp.]
MLRNILIFGIDSWLGSAYAARCLQLENHRVLYAADQIREEEAVEWVASAARQINNEKAVVRSHHEISELLRPSRVDFNVKAAVTAADADIAEVWVFADAGSCADRPDSVKTLISCWPTRGAGQFNYVQVYTPSTCNSRRVDSSYHAPESAEDISQLCKAQNISCRMFHTSLIVGDGTRLQPRDIFYDFLSELHAFKLEIEERSPQYFDFHALRCFAPRNAALNLIAADAASELLLRMARAEIPEGHSCWIGSSEDTAVSALCERLSLAYNLSILPVEDPGTLNAVDRAFHERLGRIQEYLTGKPERPAGEVNGAAEPNDAVFGEEDQIELFESVRRNQDNAAASRRQRIANLPGRFIKKTIVRKGSELSYYVAGSTGPVVVLLNALGQSLEYWYRLMDTLMESYRVIIWEARGTISPPQPFGLSDQADDLEEVLKHEDVEACHAVCWCTSPKVAIDFHLRRPSVFLTMTFLNATFKCDGSPEEFDTPYEKNLASLCRMLVKKPAMASSVMKTFQSRSEENEIEILEGPDSEQMSISVLSMMSAELKPYVLGPFRTEETTLNYAHQMMDFWANDSRQKASRVTIPVLLIGAEHDQVISPDSSEMGARLFPNARHVHLTGATHYFLYDRAELLAGLLKMFFENSGELPIKQRAQAVVAQAG